MILPAQSNPLSSLISRATILIGTSIVGLIFSLPVHAEDWVSNLKLRAGFVPDPYTTAVTAGGPIEALEFGTQCAGFINPQSPALVFEYDAINQTSKLGFFVDSSIDTTLVVVAPDGQVHCNDDSVHLANANPGLELGSAVSGQYRVMVGSYESEQAGESATLVVTEYGPAMWMALDLNAGFDSLVLNMVNSEIDFGDDSGDWAGDGECDDPRFLGNGMAMMPSFDHEGRDASDCRVLFGLGEVRLARPQVQ